MNQKFNDTSCVACKLCNLFGELTCSDCETAKEVANATRIEAPLEEVPASTLEATRRGIHNAFAKLGIQHLA